jgi:integrase
LARKRGQIISRGKRSWLVRVYLGRDQVTGRRRYHSRTIAGRLRDAQRYLNSRLDRQAEGRELVDARITLNQFLDRWLAIAARPKLRTKSYRDYKALLDRYIRPALGERLLSRLTPLDLQNAIHAMNERRLSARTVRYTHAVLHSSLDQAVAWRMLSRNPSTGIALPKLSRSEMRVFTPEQARHFLCHALKTQYGSLFALALTTGMRPSEYLALRWADIDWANESVTVSRTLEKGRGWKFAETKRARSRRTVKLQSWVATLLRQQQALETKKGSEYSASAVQIFQTTHGRPLNSDYLARQFKKILRAAGLPEIRLYDLRHTAATLALAAGVSPKVVCEQLGHANSAFTLDVYSHVLPHMQAEAAQRVEAVLDAYDAVLKTITAGLREAS